MSTQVSNTEEFNPLNPDHLKADDNIVPDVNSLGIQNYRMDDEGIGEDDVWNYNDITGASMDSVVGRATTNDLTLPQLKSGLYKRVIIIRYTGEIREVIPEEHENLKDFLLKGLYKAVTIYWALRDQKGLTPSEWNKKQVYDKVLKVIDRSLHYTTLQWFQGQADFDGVPSRRLVADVANYRSPLIGR